MGIYCDETGMGGSPFYGFGSLWMPWERRGDLAAILKRIRQQHFDQELKWNGVKKRSAPMYRGLVREFFERSWLSFHCLLVHRSDVQRALHRDIEQAMQKHYTMLIGNKVTRLAAEESTRRFFVRVDSLPFGYAKSDETMGIVLNNLTRKLCGRGAVASVRAVNSKNTAGIQLCDVLLGAVASAWQGADLASAKREMQYFVAEHLGWQNLKADTWSKEQKFNIWIFHDPKGGKRRRATSREVKLKYPLGNFHLPGGRQ